MDLDNLTLDELKDLQKKLNDREAELKEIQIKAKQKIAETRINIIREHKDAILSLMHHGRSSCSDEDPCNGYGTANNGARCNKCHLIEILEGQHGNRFDIKLYVDIINTEE